MTAVLTEKALTEKALTERTEIKRPKIQMLAVSKTEAGDNDRTVFNDADLADLAKSISDNGLIQPISVRIKPGGVKGGAIYQIIAGERRFRAISQKLGWETFPGIVLEATDEEAASVMLAENTARASIDPIDEAKAYDKRMKQFGWKEDEVAKRAGVSGARVRQRLKLLRLEPTVQIITRSGQFPLGYAQILVDGDLPYDGQLSAMRLFNSQQRPTLEWFREVVLKLMECKQTGMFEDFELELMVQQVSGESKPDKKRLPRPAKNPAPVVGETLREILENQVAHWEAASKAWNSINSPFIALEADAAAAAIRGILSVLIGETGEGQE